MVDEPYRNDPAGPESPKPESTAREVNRRLRAERADGSCSATFGAVGWALVGNLSRRWSAGGQANRTSSRSSSSTQLISSGRAGSQS